MYNGMLNIRNTTVVSTRYMTQGGPAPKYKHYVPTKHRYILEDGTDRLSETSVTNYVPTLHNIPEEQRPQLYCGRSLKSHMMVDFFHIAKLQKVTISCVMVCLSTWISLAPIGQMFKKFDTRAFFKSLSAKFMLH
jgi:hypothetical protein